MPLYRFDAVEELILPKGCVLIGVELLHKAAERPSFRHPLSARLRVRPRSAARCLPAGSRAAITSCAFRPGSASTSAAAGAVVMYDRMLCTSAASRRGRCAPAARPSPCARTFTASRSPAGPRASAARTLARRPPQFASGDEERALVIVLGRIDRREQQGHHLPDQLVETRSSMLVTPSSSPMTLLRIAAASAEHRSGASSRPARRRGSSGARQARSATRAAG